MTDTNTSHKCPHCGTPADPLAWHRNLWHRNLWHSDMQLCTSCEILYSKQQSTVALEKSRKTPPAAEPTPTNPTPHDNVRHVFGAHPRMTVGQALGEAEDSGFSDVIITGWVDDVLTIYSSRMTNGEALWLVEKTRQAVLRGSDDD